ncbi:tetratricopeptide repeat protein [Crateriforma conspicua]|uniref:tetratricopeptide repeat protein n=1 Tax=Crateriforma TaxID=2714592 RepID=UPI0018CEE138|nr:tetratricopeptide repeat protein [Crateriforma conspicua]
MPNPIESSDLAAAYEQHRRGDLDAAEAAYRRLIERRPDAIQPVQLLGALLVQTDRPGEAVTWIRKAIELQPTVAEYHVNLGSAYSRLKNYPEAITAYRAAIRLRSNYVDAYRNLGSVLVKSRRFEDAIEPLSKAHDLDPTHRQTVLRLARAYLRAGQAENAMACFDAVVKQHPNDEPALLGLAQSLLNVDDASPRLLDLWKRLSELRPDDHRVWLNLSSAALKNRQPRLARDAVERSLELCPGFGPALCQLGIVESSEGRFESAETHLRKALATSDELGDPVDNESSARSVSSGGSTEGDQDGEHDFVDSASRELGNVLAILGRTDEALRIWKDTLAAKPDDVDLRLNIGFVQLSNEDLRNGFEAYELRCQTKNAPRTFDRPRWDGSHQPDKHLLVHCEQGLGDQLHFVRFLKDAAERVAAVTLLSHRPLTEMMQVSDSIDPLGFDHLEADGDPIARFDLHLPLMSLPHVLNVTIDRLADRIPYLHSDPSRVDSWRRKLESVFDDGIRIGIAWQGNPDFVNDHQRSFHLRELDPIARLDCTEIVSLQKGAATDQVRQVDFEIQTLEGLDEEAPFLDSSAVMQQLDLVVTSDSAIAHLSGALGVRTWLALPFNSEWRWFRGRTDSPWYPSMTLFRQPSPGDWKSVFQAMATRLEQGLDQPADATSAS